MTAPYVPIGRYRWLVLLALAFSAFASAQTVYKCTDAQGQLSFQDRPCAHPDQQQVLHLHVADPDPGPAPAPAESAPPSARTVTLKRTTRVVTHTYTVPQLYRCIHATDGKTYISRNGHPPAYRAPLGIIGAFQMPLSETYGGKNAIQRAASDPQLAKGRITSGLVADHYTWVRDTCQPMSPPAICATLKQQLSDTQDAIDKAFKSDRPPLQKKADTLRKESAQCPP